MHDTTSAVPQIPVALETNFSQAKSYAGAFIADKVNIVGAEDSDSTIRRALSHYELGRKIRHLRLKKKIALVDLGKHTGLSASMLSQLENGKLVPTLPTLARIAMVFDVGLDYFFADRRKSGLFAIVRAADRIRFPDKPDAADPAYFFESLDFAVQDKSMQAYLAEFPAREVTQAAEHVHAGAELIYVLEGVLKVHYQDEDHRLEAGDSVYFDASEPHSYRAEGERSARIVVVTTPPRA